MLIDHSYDISCNGWPKNSTISLPQISCDSLSKSLSDVLCKGIDLLYDVSIFSDTQWVRLS